MTKAKHIDRTRWDPNEDYMPSVTALQSAIADFQQRNPGMTPAHCPLAACGYRGTGPGRPCPNVGNMITGVYGTGAHGLAVLVAEVSR